MTSAARTDIESVSRELLIAFAIVGCGGYRCWRFDDKDLSYEVKFCRTVSVGKKAVMTDAMESIGQSMQKEAADELVGG